MRCIRLPAPYIIHHQSTDHYQVKVLEDSGTAVPQELRDMLTGFEAKVKVGQAKVHGCVSIYPRAHSRHTHVVISNDGQ